MSIRAAVGAGRARLIAQLLTENLLLGALGGSAGVAAVLPEHRSLARLPSGESPPGGRRAYGHRDAAVHAVVALVCGIVTGVAPALAASRPVLQEAMKEGRTSPSRQRLQGALVVAEIAFATILLIGCGLLVKHCCVGLHQSGLDPEGVLTLKVALPDRSYPNPAGPGEISSASFSSVRKQFPRVESRRSRAACRCWARDPRPGSRSKASPRRLPGGRPTIPVAGVSDDYFHTLGIPVLRGRGFISADAAGPRAAIINQAVADRFFAGQDPLGKRITDFRLAAGSGVKSWA